MATRAAIGLSRHSDIELPKQRTASDLASEIVARISPSPVCRLGANRRRCQHTEATRGELLGRLDTLGKRLQLLGAQANLPPSEMELLSAQWGKYVREIGDVIAVAASDPPMASMLLSATDDEFQSIAAKLQGISGLVANQTRATSHELARGAEENRNILALGGLVGVLISGLVTLFVGRSIVAPIRSITQAMRGLSSGQGA